jgi:uncharacterized membrane protein YsdA (DUF1294 family)
MKTFCLIYLFIINLSSLALMFIDKKKAIQHKWRIRENTLLLFALVGGSIGTFLGMHIFRHKTNHFKFKILVPYIISIQMILIFFYLLKFK